MMNCHIGSYLFARFSQNFRLLKFMVPSVTWPCSIMPQQDVSEFSVFHSLDVNFLAGLKSICTTPGVVGIDGRGIGVYVMLSARCCQASFPVCKQVLFYNVAGIYFVMLFWCIEVNFDSYGNVTVEKKNYCDTITRKKF